MKGTHRLQKPWRESEKSSNLKLRFELVITETKRGK